MRFFRKIRIKLLAENRLSKYFVYAIGEILLVVIGILLALQINSWNSNRQQNKKILNYYSRISKEIEFEISNQRSIQLDLDTLLAENKRSLHLLKMNNRDSLFKLSETLGALGTTYTSKIALPITNKFISLIDESEIVNDSILMQLQVLNFYLERFKGLDATIEFQYANSIEPFFYKNINYAEVARENHKFGLIQGGPATPFESFADNLELWNIITFKIELLTAQNESLKSFIEFMERFNRQLKAEVK